MLQSEFVSESSTAWQIGIDLKISQIKKKKVLKNLGAGQE